MRTLLFTILAAEAVWGATSVTSDVSSIKVQARSNGINSFRDSLFEPGFGLNQGHLFSLQASERQDDGENGEEDAEGGGGMMGFGGLPVIIPGVPTELIIVAVIAKIILVVILGSGVVASQAAVTNGLSNNVRDGPTTPIDNTVNDVLANNPQLLSSLAATILPSLLPLITAEGREVDTDLIMERTDATAFARLDGIKGELYFAQIKPIARTVSSTTVVAGALEGFKPDSKYRVSVHKSGDTTDSCKNVGDRYEGTAVHTFSTDSQGRSVLLLHEEEIKIRGDFGIMGRSVVIKDEGGTVAYCGIIINA